MKRKKTEEPTVKLSKKAATSTFLISVPDAIIEAIERCAEQDSIIFGRRVATNEIVLRALIDRVGATFGTKYARELYRRFFNGIVALEPKSQDLPEISTLPFGYAEADS